MDRPDELYVLDLTVGSIPVKGTVHRHFIKAIAEPTAQLTKTGEETMANGTDKEKYLLELEPPVDKDVRVRKVSYFENEVLKFEQMLKPKFDGNFRIGVDDSPVAEPYQRDERFMSDQDVAVKVTVSDGDNAKVTNWSPEAVMTDTGADETVPGAPVAKLTKTGEDQADPPAEEEEGGGE